jgi:tRNA-dihydrouridine synthase
MSKSLKLYMAPVMGVTDSLFRTGFAKYFGGFYKYFAPFIKTSNGDLKDKFLRDLSPERNLDIKVVPQVLSKDKHAIVAAAAKVQHLGYGELNWNLGCPMPTSTKKRLGSGLLPWTDEIDIILEYVFSRVEIDISIKTRLGLHSSDDIKKLIPVFNSYPVKELIIHPRTGIQQYGGSVDLRTFAACQGEVKAPVVYNGDICTEADFQNLRDSFSDVTAWMVGRGALQNPGLPRQILNGQTLDRRTLLKQLREFHLFLYNGCTQRLSGCSQLLQRMKSIDKYLLAGIDVPEKLLKKTGRVRTCEEYENMVEQIWLNI